MLHLSALLLLITSVLGSDTASAPLAVTTPPARLAHVTLTANQTNGRRLSNKSPSRAEQTVAANEWWCAFQDKADGLSCRRHRLQQRHRLAADDDERETIRSELTSLLETAGQAARAVLQEETRAMLRSFCALATSKSLEVCVASRFLAPSLLRENPTRRWQSLAGRPTMPTSMRHMRRMESLNLAGV